MAIVGWPDGVFPRVHNASNEPCDMLSGPCCCGAYHSLDEWVIRRRSFDELKAYCAEREMQRLTARRQMLAANNPKCPQCPELDQIQLVDHISAPPARWRCRSCGHRFA